MVLNNIEITVADCLLNLSRAGKTTRTLPPKKRFQDVRARENFQPKRSRMSPLELNGLDGYNGITAEQMHIRNNINCLPAQRPIFSPMTPTMFRSRDAYQVGHLQTHPLSPFDSYHREFLREAPASPYILHAATPAYRMAPVSPGSRTSSESESVGEYEEVSRPASIVSESSTNDSGNNEAADLEPTCDDVLIGTGRTCSAHKGNKLFHREIYESCEEYFRADYKKGIVERVIKSVQKRGGRFLASTKKGPWRLVVDMDRLERNTRKSFHMARKQKVKEQEVTNQSQNIIPSLVSSPQQAQQVAVYVPEMRSFCTGRIEKKCSNGDLFVCFDDQRLGADWINAAKTDMSILSR